MYVLRVLNDAGEWETAVKLFDSAKAAQDHFHNEMQGYDLWDACEVVKMETEQ
jgi:hypothetical protein